MPVINNLKKPAQFNIFQFIDGEWTLVDGYGGGGGGSIGPNPSDVIPQDVTANDGLAGTSLLYSRGDHSHEFSIDNQQEGDLIFFDGDRWIRLPVAQDGYLLTSISNVPTWSELVIPAPIPDGYINISNWYVDRTTGNDNNDGETASTALKTLDEWTRRLFPNGEMRILPQAVNLHIGPGTYTRLVAGLAAGSNPLTVLCANKKLSNVTLSTVINTVPGTTTVGSGTRGQVISSDGYFVVGQQLLCIAGSHPGAIAYVQKLNGDGRHAFVSHWHINTLGYRATQVNLTSGDIVAAVNNFVDIPTIDLSVGNGAVITVQNLGTDWTKFCTIKTNDFNLISGIRFDACQGFFQSNTGSSFKRCQGHWFMVGGSWFFYGGNQWKVQYLAVSDNNTNVLMTGGDCVGDNGLSIYGSTVNLSFDLTAATSSYGLQFEDCGGGSCIGINFNGNFQAAAGLPIWGVTGAPTGNGITIYDGTFYNAQSQLPTINCVNQLTIGNKNYTYSQAPIVDTGSNSSFLTFTPDHTRLSIIGQTQGDVIYFNGTDWVVLHASTDGYVLTTHGVANPTWTSIASLSLTSSPPVNVNGLTAAVGTAITAARSDHKHNIDSASAVSVGAANSAGTATTLALSDHTHQVIDLHLTSQAQGNITYFNGSNWVVLAPGTSGNVLTTNGASANPAWTAPLLLTSSAPVNVDGTSAAVGTATTAARSDHKHNVNFGTPVAVGAANSAGSATTLVRSDHTHQALASQITNDSTVIGSFSSDALNNLLKRFQFVTNIGAISTYTLLAADIAGLYFSLTGSNIAVTIPPNSSVPFPLGACISFMIFNAGSTFSFIAGAGVTVHDLSHVTATVFSIKQITKIATNTWIITSDTGTQLNSTEILNDSVVPGTTVSDAINYVDKYTLHGDVTLPLSNVYTDVGTAAWGFLPFVPVSGAPQGFCALGTALACVFTGPIGPFSAPATTLSGMRVRIIPAGGHGANLPATMPTLTVAYIDDSGGSNVIGTVTDASATVAAYEAPHNLSLTFIGAPFSSNKSFFFTVTSETGTHALALTVLISATATFI